jgi:hypothetical protein
MQTVEVVVPMTASVELRLTPDFPIASAGTSQAPSDAVEKSHGASHTGIRTLLNSANAFHLSNLPLLPSAVT